VKTRARWFRVKGSVKKPKYPLMEPQPVATVSCTHSNSYHCSHPLLAGSQTVENGEVRPLSTEPYPGVSSAPLLHQSRTEQAVDLRRAIHEQTVAIRRLFSEQSRINAEADREYSENGGRPIKPNPRLTSNYAELSAHMRARDILYMQLDDLHNQGSDEEAPGTPFWSEASHSVRTIVVDTCAWLMPFAQDA
jgi:hypothetical protein